LLWVSSLRDPGVQAGVIDLLRSQRWSWWLQGPPLPPSRRQRRGWVVRYGNNSTFRCCSC
jgi:hypothetical protein